MCTEDTPERKEPIPGTSHARGPVRIMTQHRSSRWAHVLFQNPSQAFQVAVEIYPRMQAKAYLSFMDSTCSSTFRGLANKRLATFSDMTLGIPSELHLQLGRLSCLTSMGLQILCCTCLQTQAWIRHEPESEDTSLSVFYTQQGHWLEVMGLQQLATVQIFIVPLLSPHLYFFICQMGIMSRFKYRDMN